MRPPTLIQAPTNDINKILFRNANFFTDICPTNDGLVSTVLSRYARHIGIFFALFFATIPATFLLDTTTFTTTCCTAFSNIDSCVFYCCKWFHFMPAIICWMTANM